MQGAAAQKTPAEQRLTLELVLSDMVADG